MLPRDVLALRLRNQQLSGYSFQDPADVVRWLGAVQSQDYYGATWALGQRVPGATVDLIDRAFQDGAFVRTHAMRPTWHFVAPADLRWIQMLTGPRVKMLLGHYDPRLGIDAELVRRTAGVFERALVGGNFQTRDELAALLAEAGIAAKGQMLAHLVMHLELDALICSGPRRGKQHTYALVDERVPAAPMPTRDDALAELSWRYFRSHGPATLRDFAWWSGLTVGDAKRGAELNAGRLVRERIEGKQYWLVPSDDLPALPDVAYLLPNYDEYGVAYRERDLFYDSSRAAGAMEALTHVLVLNGRVAGTWGRALAKDTVAVTTSWFDPPTEAEVAAVAAAAERYGTFLGLHPTVA
jgi:hypothetical protein